jgi:preprotein translocase subunit SecF
MVGAKVGDELTHKGLMALLLSFVGILIYVAVRFDWKFALVSILSLLHDVVIAIGAVSFAQVEVNLDVLAAILTLLGYSLNDTIIIFDRIRERVQISKENDLDELINESVSRTLPRTTLTALTVFFTVFTLYTFGGEIIHGFAFTMLVGVIFGTYSSIFVASALLVPLKFSVAKYREKEAEKVRLKKEKERNRAMFEQGRV